MRDEEINQKIISSFRQYMEARRMDKKNKMLSDLSLIKEAVHKKLLGNLFLLKITRKLLERKEKNNIV